MEFCNNCGKILEIKRTSSLDAQELEIKDKKRHKKIPDIKKIAICSCGFEKELTKEIVTTEKIKEKAQKGDGIFDNEKEETKHNKHSGKFPHRCKKCNNNEAEIIEIKTGFSDESDIYLFKCSKCDYTERQADGSSNK